MQPSAPKNESDNAQPDDNTLTKKGWIIDFHAADGYGFVRTDDGVRYLFLAEAFCADGNEVPAVGRPVSVVVPKFCDAGRTPRALSLRLDQDRSSEAAPREATPDASGRISCPHCGLASVPRLFYNNGMLEGNLCPVCFKPITLNEPLPEIGSPSSEQFWQTLIVTLILDQALKAVLKIDLDD